MKKNLLSLMGLVLLFSILITSCDGDGGGKGQPPVDEGRAFEHIIPLDSADAWIKSFGEIRTQLVVKDDTAGTRVNSESFPISERFNRDAIQLLLNQDGAAGVRIYLGKDTKGLVRLILLPVDAKGNDIRKMLIDQGNRQAAQAGIAFKRPVGQAVEDGDRCPNNCPTN